MARLGRAIGGKTMERAMARSSRAMTCINVSGRWVKGTGLSRDGCGGGNSAVRRRRAIASRLLFMPREITGSSPVMTVSGCAMTISGRTDDDFRAC